METKMARAARSTSVYTLTEKKSQIRVSGLKRARVAVGYVTLPFAFDRWTMTERAALVFDEPSISHAGSQHRSRSRNTTANATGKFKKNIKKSNPIEGR